MGAKLESRKVVLLALSAAALGCCVLSIIVELNEIALPYDIQMDELRLLDAEVYDDLNVNPQTFTVDSAENALADLVQCRKKLDETSTDGCLTFAQTALQKAPTDGALWVEYARELAASGADGQAIGHALLRSHAVSHNEMWVINKRISLALSVWPALEDDAKSTIAAETIENLSDNEFMTLLADTYVQRPLIRQTLTDVMTKATAQQQNRFLQLVKNRST